jgi:hypothetical protein
MFPYPAICILSLVILAVGACTRLPLEEAPRDEAPLRVRVEVTDGIRTVDRLLRRPELVITVLNGSDDTSYEAVFSINDGPERTVRSIWNGVPKDLSGELLSLSGYGPVSLKGYLYDTAVLTGRVPLDTTLWIAYAPAARGSTLILTPDREEPLVTGSVFTVGESGTLEIAYTPGDTFLHIDLSVPEGSPLVLSADGAANRGGRFSIPFSVRDAGESVITLSTRNGRDETSAEYSIVCRQPSPEETN